MTAKATGYLDMKVPAARLIEPYLQRSLDRTDGDYPKAMRRILGNPHLRQLVVEYLRDRRRPGGEA